MPEWIFIPVLSHNPQKHSYLFSNNKNPVPFPSDSHLAPVWNYSHSRTAPILDVSYLKKKKKTKFAI